MIKIKRNNVFYKSGPITKIKILEFLMEEKRILYVHGKNELSDYLESNYSEYYIEYSKHKRGKMCLPVFPKTIDIKKRIVNMVLYEPRFDDDLSRDLVLFKRPEYPKGLVIRIPFKLIESLSIY